MKSTTAGILGVLTAGAVGAALMYVLDPESGQRRRALAREKVNDLNRKGREAIAGKARELGNRAEDMAARLRRGDEPEAEAPLSS